MPNKKILTFEKLTKKIYDIKKANKTVVHCHGVFDLLHIGHIRHFKEAKNFGDVLVVTITPDKFVNKGHNRPAFNANMRLESLASLEVIDFVCVNLWSDAEKTIKKLKPSIYCKGPDYKKLNKDITGKIHNEKKAVKDINGKIKFTKDIVFSSSNLINSHFNNFTNSQNDFLNGLKKIIGHDKVRDILNFKKKPDVLLVGESIIDEYVFCEAIGKSGKEPMLVLRDMNREQFAGGAIAIAKNLSDFCNTISFLTMIGEDEQYKGFILKNLPKNVKTFFIKKKNSPTILKKRYVETNNNNKIIGIYQINEQALNPLNEKQFQNYLNKLIDKNDLIIASDYGHGLISKNSAKIISDSKKFKSINSQINALNIGYHDLKKFRNMESLIINEGELRHELKNRDGKLDSLIINLSNLLKSKYLTVTSGKEGVVLYDSQQKCFYNCPAFASNVVDKVGAGDVMLAVLSVLLHQKINISLSLFVASIAASESVESIGNSIRISSNDIIKKAEHMLK